MRDLGSLIIVHLVERRPEGTTFPRKRADWPLHVTLVPWFYIAEDKRNALLKRLQMYGAGMKPFLVHVGDEAQFGPDENVPVNLISEQTPIIELHDELMTLVKEYSDQFHSSASAFSGVEQHYRAHITHHQAAGGWHRRYQGDEELFDSISVARLLDNNGTQMCEIIQNVKFGNQGNEEAA